MGNMKVKLNDVNAYYLREYSQETENYLLRGEPGSDVLFLLCKESEEDHPEESEMLIRLIRAIGRDPERLAFVAVAKEDLPPYKLLKKDFSFAYMIAFGLQPSDLGLNIEAKGNEIVRMGERALLFTAGYKELEGKQESKAALWRSMQILFDLKKKK